MDLICFLNSYHWTERHAVYWRWNNDGTFSVVSFFKFLNYEGLIAARSRVTWQNAAPLKVRFLLWLVVQNKLLTVDNLGKRTIRVRNVCVFFSFTCHVENAMHLFVKCPSLSSTWKFVQSCLLS